VTRTIGEALGVPLDVAADTVAPFHPGRCARVTLTDGTVVGHVGELHPKAVGALGLPARTVGGELDLDVLTRAAEPTVQAHTLHTFPMAQSDVAVVVDEAVPAAAVQRSLSAGAGEHLEALTLFDVYRGEQVGEGRKSLAYRLTFRAPDRTLTTDEVSALRDTALRSAAQAVGAVQRA
jgi:phenylalanyl-tRNA synthetase beta chain